MCRIRAAMFTAYFYLWRWFDVEVLLQPLLSSSVPWWLVWTWSRCLSSCRSTIRALNKNFSIAFFFPAFITLLFFQHNRTVYDMVAGTIVVKRTGARWSTATHTFSRTDAACYLAQHWPRGSVLSYNDLLHDTRLPRATKGSEIKHPSSSMGFCPFFWNRFLLTCWWLFPTCNRV